MVFDFAITSTAIVQSLSKPNHYESGLLIFFDPELTNLTKFGSNLMKHYLDFHAIPFNGQYFRNYILL